MTAASINLLIALAAVSNLSDHSDREWFLNSLMPSVGYTSVATMIWLIANRRAIKNRKVSLRSLLILIAALSPGLAMLRLVYWPHLW